MLTTIFLSKIFGPLFLVTCIALLFNRKTYQKIFQQIISDGNTMVMFYLSVATFTIGILLVLIHNIWTNPAEVIVSIIAWGALIKGTLLLIFPNAFKSHIRYITQGNMINVFIPIGLLLGAYLTGVGYF